MEYTREQLARFRQEYAVRRRNQFYLAVPLVVVVILVRVAKRKGEAMLLGVEPSTWVPVFLAMVAGAIIFSIKNWRCPACNKYLGKGFNPAFCAKCGVPLK